MPIQLLSPQLANQIAAGEVVERPAAVVKELVENSLDAGATRIDIEVTQGGAGLMRVRDNGCGIAKEELPLALARHATSKISSLEDLQAIRSQGFRGEALASISSVSRLTLTSRTATQSQAWQVYAEGRDRTITVRPASHPLGSTVEVLDLFYNTPARRRFMRTEKTEFAHIDEVIRRIALARFDVTLVLHHNHKCIRQYRAVDEHNPSQHERRLAGICGAVFLQHAVSVVWKHGDLAISGWVAVPAGVRIPGEIQYCYVNRRIVRDRLINHAIQQAHQDVLKEAPVPIYILYLEIAPHQVDVNVHPAKHEVRFHQARLVHDFIYQAVVRVLRQLTESKNDCDKNSAKEVLFKTPENRPAAGRNKYSQREDASLPEAVEQLQATAETASIKVAGEKTLSWHADKFYHKQQGALYGSLLNTREVAAKQPAVHQAENRVVPQLESIPLQNTCDSFGRVLTIYPPCYALIERHDGMALMALTVADSLLKQAQFTPPAQGLPGQPLLIPLKLTLNETEVAALNCHQHLLTVMGIELVIEHQQVMLCAVPLALRQQNLQKLILAMSGYLSQHQQVSPQELAVWITDKLVCEHEVWGLSQAVRLLADVERVCPQLVKHPPAALLQPVDLESVVTLLKHEHA